MKKQADNQTGWFLTGGSGYWPRLLLVILLGSLAAGCAAALMFTSGELISRSALHPANILIVYVPIVLVRTFGLGKAALQYAQRLSSHHVALRALSAMRGKLYRLLERQAVNLHSRYRMGELLGLLADDIEQLQNLYLRVVFPAFSGLFIYGAAIALLARSGGLIMLWLMAYGGFWLFVAPLFALWRVYAARRNHQPHRALLYRELADAWYGLTDWVLSGRTAQALASFRLRQAEAGIREHALRRMEWRRQWLSRCAAAGAVVLTVIWVSGQLDAGMETWWAAACVLAVFPIMETITSVNDALVRLPDYLASLQRLAQVQVEAELEGRESGQDDYRYASGPVDIQVERIYFRYTPASDWILKELSLSLPQGKKVAVLGRSGAGKSTFLQVLGGQRIPVKGKLTVNGQPIQAGQARYVSILNQKPYLFHTSIANNVRLGRSDASDEEIMQVLRCVGMERLVASLPEGCNTSMEEAGSRFSGGERQRIALARILLQPSPVVLLDEPTTGLDRETELDLIRTLFHVLKGRTVVWFTHRLTGMETMDEILFLERGTAIMRGSHEELMAHYGRYRSLHRLDQFA